MALPALRRPKQRYQFLEPEALRELKDLRFAARRIVEGTYAGRHRSNLRGSSCEFSEYRLYTPGDDLRRLDWKVFLRTHRPYVRTYDEETNMSVLLLLDASASMAFGGGASSGKRGASLTKLDYARYFLAALAWLIVEGRDQASLGLLGERLEGWLGPGSTRLHLDKLLHQLEGIRGQGQTRLGSCLETLYPLCRRRGLLVLVSDFLDEQLEDLFRVVRLFRHRRFEVILFHLLHPEELALPAGRACRFFDPESGQELEVDPQEIATEYEHSFAAYREQVRHLALGCGCEYELLHTRTPYPEAIRAYLRARMAVRR